MQKQCPITSHHVPSQCVRCRYFFLYCHSEALPHHDPIHVMLTFHVYRHFILYCNPFPLPFISIDVQVCCVAIKKKHNTLVNTCVFISIGNSFNCHPFIYFILLPFMLPFLYIAIHLCCHSFLSPLQFYCDSFAVQFISIVIHYVLPFIQLPFALAFIYIPSHLCCHFHSHCHSFPLPSIYINLPFMCPLCVNFY